MKTKSKKLIMVGLLTTATIFTSVKINNLEEEVKLKQEDNLRIKSNFSKYIKDSRLNSKKLEDDNSKKEILIKEQNSKIEILKKEISKKEILKKKEISKPTRGKRGNFQATAYCNCSICCGKWSGGPTKSGKMPKAGRTIAVDPNVIPLGSRVLVNGKEYKAEDTGSAIKGNIIDIYFGSHSEALKFGRQKVEVEVIK